MANLYDLELQESGQLIETLMSHGETPKLKQLRTELQEARNRQDYETAKKYESHDTEIGKALKRYTELESDIKTAMLHIDLTPDEVKRVHSILTRNPDTLTILNSEENAVVLSYWVKKKSILQRLTDLHYSAHEIYQ